jgi:surface protein
MALAHRAKVKDPAKAFISTWRTSTVYTGSTANNQIKLPLEIAGTYKFTVQWGDTTSSVITTWNQAETTHTYPAPGDYTVTITGFIKGWDWGGGGTVAPTTGDMRKLLTITQWGCLRFVTKLDNTLPILFWGPFYGCINLNLTAVQDMPNFKGTVSTFGFLRGCTAITTVNNINKWDVSKIRVFRSMFREMLIFNDNIGNWNTSSGVSFLAMFFAGNTTGVFGIFNNGNSDSIKNWNTSKAVSFNTMFTNQKNFNREVGLWDVSNVTDLNAMFSTGALAANIGTFNNAGSPSINNWNTSKVTNMLQLFQGQRFFNQPIGNWNTANVTNMNSMFYGSFVNGSPGSFNQDISNWNTSKVTNMDRMLFHQPNFNQNIGNWDVSKVTNFNNFLGGFQTGSFNNGGSDSIKNWNTGEVTSMNSMFATQKLFNQEVGLWNVSKVTTFSFMFNIAAPEFGSFNNGGTSSINNWITGPGPAITMNNMFLNQTGFNQSISNWNVSLVTNLNNFMAGKTFSDYSTANYDALLIGWASRPVQASRSVNFGTIKYTAAAVAARAILTSAPNNWTIVDGGLL